MEINFETFLNIHTPTHSHCSDNVKLCKNQVMEMFNDNEGSKTNTEETTKAIKIMYNLAVNMQF